MLPALLLLLMCLAACASQTAATDDSLQRVDGSSSVDAHVASPPSASPAAAPPSVPAPASLALEVPGFSAAVLTVPVGAVSRRPLVIATHGNYDRPEWQCQVWSEILRKQAFVLCPRGVGRPDSPAADDPRFTYKDNRELEREVDAALVALRASDYAPFIDEGAPVWAGFSLGAIMGVAIAERRPKDFTTLILVEGGVDRFRDETARAFAKGGGKKVMFVCAQRGCKGVATPRAKLLERLGVSSVVVDAGNIGHAYSGPVADAIGLELPAFLADDPRFLAVFRAGE